MLLNAVRMKEVNGVQIYKDALYIMNNVVQIRISFGVIILLHVILMVLHVVIKKEVNGVLIYKSVLYLMKIAAKTRLNSGAKILQHVI